MAEKREKTLEERAASGVLAKKADGHNYKYTDLAGVNAYIYGLGWSYEQETRPDESGCDYIYTVKIAPDGTRGEWLRGAKIVDGGALPGKANAAQEIGSAITYARRYSLLMAFGLACEDDDAESLTKDVTRAPRQAQRRTPRHGAQQDDKAAFWAYCKSQNMDLQITAESFGLTKDSKPSEWREALAELKEERNAQ